MAKAQTVWGIDLGRYALKAVKLRLGADGKVEMLGHDFVEHAKILTQPDADRPELISTALDQFLSRNDLSKDGVVVGVPGQHTLARFTKLPPVAPKRIPDIVRYEADQQIPFDMDEVIWDYQTFQQEGAPDLEVGIFAMKRELLREHLLHFEQAGIEPICVQCGPLAVYNAAHFDALLGDETTVLLDIGAENTDLIIATVDTFWTRTVPIGGNTFTNALMKAFKLAFSKAENLKRTAESSKYARQIFQAMRPVFADLVQELQRSIGFYTSTHRDSKIVKIICFGEGARLPGLRKYLQQNLSLPVEKPTAFQQAPIVGGGSEIGEHFLGFAGAYGLALQGLDLGKVASNLLPREIAKQIVWQKKRPAFAAAAACLVLAGGLVWFRQSSDLKAIAVSAVGSVSNPRNVDDAWSTINSGPNRSLPDRAQAQAVLSAGQLLKKELGSIQGNGSRERSRTQQLIVLQHNKSVVPRILQVIHEAIPVPQEVLAVADSPAAVLDAMRSTKVPRQERMQLSIEELQLHYELNVNSYEWETIEEVEEPYNNPDDEIAAIKIEMKCRTAHKDRTKFVADTFMAALRERGRKPDTGFYIDRVYLFDGRKVVVRRGFGTTRTRTSGRTSVNPFGRAVRTAPTPSVVSYVGSANLDPITNEPITDDWIYEIWMDVILEDCPDELLADARDVDDGEDGRR